MNRRDATPIPLVIAGIGGRMGRAVAEAALADRRVQLVAGIEHAAWPGWDRGAAAIAAGERTTPVALAHSVSEAATSIEGPRAVLVEFCLPEGALAHARDAAARGWAVVSGSTGLDPREEETLRALGARIALVRAANFSRGAAAMVRLAAALRHDWGTDFDAEIVETHHRGKRDAPSGTALAIAAALGATPASGTLRVGRTRESPPRAAGEVTVHALREGDVVGEHRLVFAGPGEVLEITHRVHARSAFAAGVIEAAVHAACAPPGVYGADELAPRGAA